MKIIAKLIDIITDELDGAEEYALTAMQEKSEHPKLAARLNELAGVELTHVRALHTEVERLISDYRTDKGEPPAEMLAVYRYEHDKAIKRFAQIKAAIEEFDA